MRYLDPKADLTFKKVFGEHPDLVISLLNALLPFGTPEEEIEEIEYLSPEQVPVTPLMRYTIVNVSCRDKRGRLFLVEIQVLWSIAFMQRVLFSDSKAYVRSLRSGREIKYDLLQPVYSLNLVNDIFLPDIPDAYHDYKIVQVEQATRFQRQENGGTLAAVSDGNRRAYAASPQRVIRESGNLQGGDAN